MKRSSHQSGSIDRKPRKNGPDVWVLRYRDGDEYKSKVLGTVEKIPTKAAARKAALAFQGAINEYHEVVTFGQLADRFEQEDLPERVSTTTGYKSNLRRLRNRWDKVRLDEIVRNAYVFEKWLSELMTTPGHGPVRPMSKKSRTNIKWLMHQMVDRAMVWGMLEARENVIAKVKVKSRPGERTRVAGMVTVEEFEQMLLDTTVPVIVRVMIAVAMCTGIRASEILGLRWEVVDLENGFISIEVSSVGKEQDDTKTVSSREDVPMCDELRMILMRWKEQLPANQWMGVCKPGDWQTLLA